jgi:hypothetical protein
VEAVQVVVINFLVVYEEPPEHYYKCEVIYCSPSDSIVYPVTARHVAQADFAFLRVKLPVKKYAKKKPLFPILPVQDSDVAVIAFPVEPSTIYAIFPQIAANLNTIPAGAKDLT